MKLEVFDLGPVDYPKADQFQKEVFIKVKEGRIKHALILCRHNPVITFGRKARLENIIAPDKDLENRLIKINKTERGGDVTYHGPGQLTAWPVINLGLTKKDIHAYLRSLESIIIQVLQELGIKAQTKQGLTGVWVDNKKIASVGIAIRNWITFHGLSINIKRNDLENFSLIRPCGMDIMMTSVETVLSREIEIDQVKQLLIKEMEKWLK